MLARVCAVCKGVFTASSHSASLGAFAERIVPPRVLTLRLAGAFSLARVRQRAKGRAHLSGPARFPASGSERHKGGSASGGCVCQCLAPSWRCPVKIALLKGQQPPPRTPSGGGDGTPGNMEGEEMLVPPQNNRTSPSCHPPHEAALLRTAPPPPPKTTSYRWLRH